MSTEEAGETAPSVDANPTRMTRAQAAKFLGCSARTIIRLEESGRLTRLTGKGESPQLYDADEVRKLGAELQAEKHGAQIEAIEDLDSPSKEKMVVANAVADMLAAGNDHAEEFARLAMNATQKLLDSAHKDSDRFRQNAEREAERLTKRIEKLEAREDEVMRALEAQWKSQYDLELAKAEVAKKEKLYGAGSDFLKLLAPGVAARINPNAPNLESIQKTGFDRLFQGMSKERREDLQATLMGKLTADEQMAFFLLFATAEEKKAEEQAKKGDSQESQQPSKDGPKEPEKK